ncbi:hypothetical protein VQ042_11540 [Aurantimonas sp. A2-1-M11]|uniref:hypothetical protein n=1 Tax=Aurantimonas sp. A2-1-M11 TaxID=3113712 RepID=UPI002F9501D0
MADFTALQEAAIAGQEVHLVNLVEFAFAENTRRVWNGIGVLDLDGYEWIGTGELGSISSIKFGENDTAEQVTFALSGVDPEFVTLARAGDSVRGRDVTIFALFLDRETLQPLGSKWVVRQLIMDTIGYGAKGPSERSISLSAESIWTTRNLAAFAYWSDRDQQARFPGDLGCQFIPTLKNKRLAWPTF